MFPLSFAPCFLLFLMLAGAQNPPQRRTEPDTGPPLKQSQVEAMLRDDHKKSLEDADALMKLSEDLKIELEKNDRHVVSLSAIKKTEEIEKIAKRIRGRMRRY